MLWLASLMGLVAVGSVAYVDTPDDTPEDPHEEDILAPAGETNPGDIIAGSADDDTLLGDGGDDQLGGYDGDDLIEGGAGNDSAFGGAGDDTVNGDAGSDDVHGEDGDDALNGGGDDDTLYGHNDDDTLHGNDGDDTLQGSAGDDTLFGDAGDDALHGGLGDDQLEGGAGEDTLFGGWGNDTLNGVPEGPATSISDSPEGDFLNGGGGDDLIIAGQNDLVHTGTGADQIVLGDWIAQGHSALISDFSPEEDSLLFVWDDSGEESAEPEIALTPDPDNAGQLQVLLGDHVVARVAGDSDLTDADIALVPLSLATSTGLIPA